MLEPSWNTCAWICFCFVARVRLRAGIIIADSNQIKLKQDNPAEAKPKNFRAWFIPAAPQEYIQR
jgi:hypothetical protein